MYEAIAPEDLRTLHDEDAGLLVQNEILKSRISDLEGTAAEYKEQLRDAREVRGSRKRQRTWSEADSTVGNDKDKLFHGQSSNLDGAAVPDFLRHRMSLASSDDNNVLSASPRSSTVLRLEKLPGRYLFSNNLPGSYGVKEILSILNALGRDTTDQTFDAYLALVDPIHHYMPIPCLRQWYNRCWSAEQLPQAHEVALVFAILALGDLASQNLHSWFLMSASLHLLWVSNSLARPTTDAICVMCYFAAYLNYEGRLGELWPVLGMSVRMAQSMGLHRDPSIVSDLPVAEAELRRRLFWTIAATETISSTEFGRPNGLGFFDCNLPKNISDSELLEGQKASSSAVNEATFNRLLWELAFVSRDMLHNMPERSTPTTIDKLKSLELRLLTWFHALPAPFRLDTNATSPEMLGPAESRIQYFQSLIIYIIVQHGILVLYRKSVLSHEDVASKQPCFEAAFAILGNWKTLQDSFPQMVRVVWMHWVRAFHAALICFAIIRTDGPDSKYRIRALSCWESALQIFARIKHQNESIMECYRALDRLDVVLKKEMENNFCPKRSSHQELLHDRRTMAASSSTRHNPFTPTIQGSTLESSNTFENTFPERRESQERMRSARPDVTSSKAPGNPMAISAALDNGESSATRGSRYKALYQDALTPSASLANAQPTGGGSTEFWFATFSHHHPDLFDVDTQNWPEWLVEPQNTV